MVSASLVQEICRMRPAADHTVEQYLMTAASLSINSDQILLTTDEHKTILLLGDDDHLSLLLAAESKSHITVLESDQRIIDSLLSWKDRLRLSRLNVVKHDLKCELPSMYLNCFDCFVANPPYGSKNGGYGILVWATRGLQALKRKGIGLMIIPIDFLRQWSMSNLLTLQKYLSKNGAVMFDISRGVHQYQDLPSKDIDMRSSFLRVQLLEEPKHLLMVDPFRNLYR